MFSALWQLSEKCFIQINITYTLILHNATQSHSVFQNKNISSAAYISHEPLHDI